MYWTFTFETSMYWFTVNHHPHAALMVLKSKVFLLLTCTAALMAQYNQNSQVCVCTGNTQMHRKHTHTGYTFPHDHICTHPGVQQSPWLACSACGVLFACNRPKNPEDVKFYVLEDYMI